MEVWCTYGVCGAAQKGMALSSGVLDFLARVGTWGEGLNLSGGLDSRLH